MFWSGVYALVYYICQNVALKTLLKSENGKLFTIVDILYVIIIIVIIMIGIF